MHQYLFQNRTNHQMSDLLVWQLVGAAAVAFTNVIGAYNPDFAAGTAGLQ